MAQFKKGEEIRVKGGRFKDALFRIEANIIELKGWGANDLPTLASKGNWAAINAIQIDNYKYTDAPFYYGKIDSLGYIISGKDLGLNK